MAVKYALILAFTSLAFGQDLPQAPSFSKADKVLLVTLTGLNGIDAWSTVRNVGRGSIEYNPVARPFIKAGSGPAAAYFASTAALDWFVARQLVKRGHRKWAKVYLLSSIGIEVWCVSSSLSWRNFERPPRKPRPPQVFTPEGI